MGELPTERINIYFMFNSILAEFNGSFFIRYKVLPYKILKRDFFSRVIVYYCKVVLLIVLDDSIHSN